MAKAKPPGNPPDETEVELEVETETKTPVSAKPFNPMEGNTNNRKRLKEDEDDFNSIKTTLSALDEKISKLTGGEIIPTSTENPPKEEPKAPAASKPWHEEWLL